MHGCYQPFFAITMTYLDRQSRVEHNAIVKYMLVPCCRRCNSISPEDEEAVIVSQREFEDSRVVNSTMSSTFLSDSPEQSTSHDIISPRSHIFVHWTGWGDIVQLVGSLIYCVGAWVDLYISDNNIDWSIQTLAGGVFLLEVSCHLVNLYYEKRMEALFDEDLLRSFRIYART